MSPKSSFCFHMLAIALSPASSWGDESVRVRNEARDKLPIISSIEIVSSQSEPSIIEMPTAFVHQIAQGRVAIRNDTDHNLNIRRVKTSCGCTAAYPRESRIVRDQSTELLVAIRPTKAGDYSIRLLLDTDNGEFPVFVKGVAKHVLEVRTQTIEVAPDAEFVTVILTANDPSIDPNDVRLSVNRESLSPHTIDQSNILFQVPIASIPAATLLTVTPLYNEQHLTSFHIAIKQPGKVRLATKHVFGVRDSDLQFRLIAIGDIPVLDLENCSTNLSVQDETFGLHTTTRMLKNTGAIIDCRVETERRFNGDPVTVFFGDHSFSIFLSER